MYTTYYAHHNTIVVQYLYCFLYYDYAIKFKHLNANKKKITESKYLKRVMVIHFYDRTQSIVTISSKPIKTVMETFEEFKFLLSSHRAQLAHAGLSSIEEQIS